MPLAVLLSFINAIGVWNWYALQIHIELNANKYPAAIFFVIQSILIPVNN